MMITHQLKGKHKFVSKEQVRCFFDAAYAVLGNHGLFPKQTVNIYIKDKIPGTTAIGGNPIAGIWIPSKSQINISHIGTYSEEILLTICLHEAIHSVIQFPPETLEKCTSTLTAKLKPAVAKVAEVLLDGIYQRAAYIAHTKISYKAKGKDHYDYSQFNKVGVKPKYRVTRIKKKTAQKRNHVAKTLKWISGKE